MFAYDYAPPSVQEAEIARTATAKIVPYVRKCQALNLRLESEAREEQIVLPAIAISANSADFGGIGKRTRCDNHTATRRTLHARGSGYLECLTTLPH